MKFLKQKIERQFIDNFIYSLHGIIDEKDKEFKKEREMNSSSIQYLSKICGICEEIDSFCTSIEMQSNYAEGITTERFCSLLREYMKQLRKKWEEWYKKKKEEMSIFSIVIKLKKRERILNSLSKIVKEYGAYKESPNSIKTSRLLSILHDWYFECKMQGRTKDEEFKVSENLFCSLFDFYKSTFLDCWIEKGKLMDSRQEFFITKTTRGKKNWGSDSFENSLKYASKMELLNSFNEINDQDERVDQINWDTLYILRGKEENKLDLHSPSFLVHFSNEILVVGKSQKFISHLDPFELKIDSARLPLDSSFQNLSKNLNDFLDPSTPSIKLLFKKQIDLLKKENSNRNFDQNFFIDPKENQIEKKTSTSFSFHHFFEQIEEKYKEVCSNCVLLFVERTKFEQIYQTFESFFLFYSIHSNTFPVFLSVNSFVEKFFELVKKKDKKK